MWGRKTAVEEPVVRRGPAVPEPIVTIANDVPDDYIAQCEAIGAKQLADIARLEMILAVEVGTAYSIAAVELFLIAESHKTGNGDATWVPLCGNIYEAKEWRRRAYRNGDGPWDSVYQHGRSDVKYAKPVPQTVLSLIATIEKEVPGEVGFYVSDYVAHNPDPFLMVEHTATGRQFIVAHWDEPNWRG